MPNKIAGLFSRVVNNRRHLYWLLQTVGWSGYVFFILLGALFWDKCNFLYVSYTVLAAVLGLLLSMGMRLCFRSIWDKPAFPRVVLTLLTVGVATGFWALWKFYEYSQIFHQQEIQNLIAEYIYWYSYSFFILLSWAGFYYGIRFYQEMQEEHEKNLRIAASAHQSQLKMLRYQLNPHFLFNTLNAISTLIMDGKGNIANNMVSALSRFLRYSLDNDPMQKVNLVQEVEAMQLYLSIEKLRFEDRLQLEFNLEKAAEKALIPSLLLQPLIENAIKYAIARNESGGTIKLYAKVIAGNLILELSDDGDGIEVTEEQMSRENGVGLSNTRQRLQQIYGDRHSCKFSNIQPHGLKVSICIPCETEDR